LAVALAGVYLLVGGGGQADAAGLLLLAGAVVASSVQTVVIQWYLQEYDGLTITFYMVAGMAVSAVGWWVVQGARWTAPTGPAWLGIAVLAVVSTYLARVAMFAAIKRLGSSQVALMVPLETMLTVAWSAIFLGERFNWTQVVGSGLIMVSAALAIERLGRVVRWPPRWRTWWRV
jgi:drug/metabolite transporter (DMT)-like permease